MKQQQQQQQSDDCNGHARIPVAARSWHMNCRTQDENCLATLKDQICLNLDSCSCSDAETDVTPRDFVRVWDMQTQPQVRNNLNSSRNRLRKTNPPKTSHTHFVATTRRLALNKRSVLAHHIILLICSDNVWSEIISDPNRTQNQFLKKEFVLFAVVVFFCGGRKRTNVHC